MQYQTAIRDLRAARVAEETERQRVAAAHEAEQRKAEEDRLRAAAQEEARRKAEEAAHEERVLRCGSAPGYVYVLESNHLKGWCKVGKTTRSVERRAAELSTGIPGKLTVYAECPTNDCHEAERQAHKALASYRNGPRDEWFRLPAKEASAILRATLGPVSERPAAWLGPLRKLCLLMIVISMLMASAVSPWALVLALAWLVGFVASYYRRRPPGPTAPVPSAPRHRVTLW